MTIVALVDFGDYSSRPGRFGDMSPWGMHVTSHILGMVKTMSPRVMHDFVMLELAPIDMH